MTARRSRLTVAALVLLWLGAALLADATAVHLAGDSRAVQISVQVLLAVTTWAVLIGLLRTVDPTVRIQVALVVVLATVVEYVFSPWLHAYTYRWGTVPGYVPPGHGLVYLASVCLGAAVPARLRRAAVAAVVVLGGCWAVLGLAAPSLLGTHRPDLLGAFWFACLLLFLWRGPSRMVYVGAFVVVSYLELLGTGLGTWTWAAQDPVLGVIGQGNPPSGAAGGYAWFDLFALLLAPRVAATLTWLRRRRGSGQSDESCSAGGSAAQSTARA